MPLPAPALPFQIIPDIYGVPENQSDLHLPLSGHVPILPAASGAEGAIEQTRGQSTPLRGPQHGEPLERKAWGFRVPGGVAIRNATPLAKPSHSRPLVLPACSCSCSLLTANWGVLIIVSAAAREGTLLEPVPSSTSISKSPAHRHASEAVSLLGLNERLTASGASK